MQAEDEPYTPDSDAPSSSGEDSPDYNEAPRSIRQRIIVRAVGITDDILLGIGFHSIGSLPMYIDKGTWVWDLRARDRLVTPDAQDQMQMAATTAMLSLQGWDVTLHIQIKRNKRWTEEGEAMTVSKMVHEAVAEGQAESGSAERFCREVNRGLKAFKLEIGKECWGWGRPVVLRQRGVQIVTVKFGRTMLLGHLRAAGEW